MLQNKLHLRLNFKFGYENNKSRVKKGREFSENYFGLMLTRQTNVRKAVPF